MVFLDTEYNEGLQQNIGYFTTIEENVLIIC